MAHTATTLQGLHILTAQKSLTMTINSAIYIGSGKELRVEAPFVNMTKVDIVKEGLELWCTI